jgi:hypothetical protein
VRDSSSWWDLVFDSRLGVPLGCRPGVSAQTKNLDGKGLVSKNAYNLTRTVNPHHVCHRRFSQIPELQIFLARTVVSGARDKSTTQRCLAYLPSPTQCKGWNRYFGDQGGTVPKE